MSATQGLIVIASQSTPQLMWAATAPILVPEAGSGVQVVTVGVVGTNTKQTSKEKVR